MAKSLDDLVPKLYLHSCKNSNSWWRLTSLLWLAFACSWLERLDPNMPGDSETGAESPLLLGVDNDAVQIVQLLLDSPRTDPNVGVQNTQINMAPLTPLMHAVEMNKEAMVKILLADPRVDLYTTENFDRKLEDRER